MSRRLVLTDTGRLEILEGSVDWFDASSNRFRLSTPTGMAGNVTLELPDADGIAGQVIQTNGAGKLSFASAGAGTVLGTGTNGRVARWSAANTITDSLIRDDGTNVAIGVAVAGAAGLEVDNFGALTTVARLRGLAGFTGTVLSLSTADDAAGLAITATDSDLNSLEITHSLGTGHAARVSCAGSGDALSVAASGSGHGIDVTRTGTGTDPAIQVTNSIANNGAIRITSNQTGGGNGVGVTMGAATTGNGFGLVMTAGATGMGVSIVQNADGEAINVDDNGDAAASINVEKDGNGAGLVVDKTTGTGNAVDFSASNGIGTVLAITTAAGATPQTAIALTANGAGDIALEVTKTGGTAAALDISNSTTAPSIQLDETNGTTNTNGALEISVTNSSSSRRALKITHSGTASATNAIQVDASGATGIRSESVDIACELESTGSNGVPALNVILSGTGGIGIDINVSANNAKALDIAAGASPTIAPIDTNVGAGTPAHLSTAGVWTDASCWRWTKKAIRYVEPAEILEKLRRFPVAFYVAKRDGRDMETLGTFQEFLVEELGLSPEGTRPMEVAVAACAAVRALQERLDRIEAALA